MANLGSLVVSLEANMAKFQSDMGRAAQTTEDAMKKMSTGAEFVKGALAGIAAGISVGAFIEIIKGSIDAADNLRDMAQKTGIAVETLNGLAFAAGQAGGSLDGMVAAAGKLNKSLSEAASGDKDVGEAFKKLGISIRDASGQLKGADVVMAEVADKFEKYADGPEKTAIALRVFGKAGADMIPLLNDGGKAMRENTKYAKKYSGVTQELADASDNFNDTMGKLAVQQKGFGNAIAAAVLPVMQAIAEEYLAMTEHSDKYALASEVVRTVFETFTIVGSEVAFTFKAVGNEIGGIIAQVDRLADGDLTGFTAIGDAMKRDAEEARKAHDAFIARVLDRGPATVAEDGTAADPKKPPAPTLRLKGDDPTKAILDARLKALEGAYASERDISAFHSQYMDGLRASATVDLETYENFKKASIQEGLDAAIRTYDAEIAALQRYRAAAGKEMERVQADGQIKEKEALKNQARIKASQDLDLLALTNEKVRNDLVKKWQAEADARTAQNEANVLNIRASLMTQTEAEQEAFDQRIDTLTRFKDAQIANEEQGNALIEAESKRHAEFMQGIQLAQGQQMVSLAGSSAGQLYSVLKDAGMEQTALGKALFVANKAIAIAEIIVNTELAAAKALAMGPIVGPPLAMGIRVLGYASAGIVLGTAIASAEGGYDIPAGTNPVTQLHEKEMVLPKAQADVIRGLANGGRGAGSMPMVTYSPVIHIDSRTDQAEVRQLVVSAVQRGNADLVDKLQRAGRI